MSILDELLEAIDTKENSLVDQIRILCDKIYQEEKDNQEYTNHEPTGPNTMLCLQVPGKRKNQIGYLTLEREFQDRYVIIYWTMNKTDVPLENPKMLRIQSWEIREEKPKKILIEYAKAYKFLRGE